MYLHKTKNEHYTPPCCYFSGELEVVESIRHNGRFEANFREEQKKGISLILCQTEKGVELVKSAGFELEEVDLDKAVTANHQLRHPSEMPDKRNTFFENIDRGFHYAISKCYPKMYYKRRLKTFLQKTKIIGGGQTVINEYDVSFKE